MTHRTWLVRDEVVRQTQDDTPAAAVNGDAGSLAGASVIQ
jgi:hypothetical protein